MNDFNIESVPTSSIKPHPQNPRSHPEDQIQKTIRSIEVYGWTSPILISSENIILAGHGRWEAAKRIGLQEVPVLRLDLDQERALAYMLADNKIASESEWAMPKLKEILSDLDPEDFVTGFDAAEIKKLVSPEVDHLSAYATDTQIQETEQRIEGEQKIKSDQAQAAYVEVTCPDCGEIFVVNATEVLKGKRYMVK